MAAGIHVMNQLCVVLVSQVHDELVVWFQCCRYVMNCGVPCGSSVTGV